MSKDNVMHIGIDFNALTYPDSELILGQEDNKMNDDNVMHVGIDFNDNPLTRTLQVNGRNSKIIKDGMYSTNDLVDLLVGEIVELDLADEVIKKLQENNNND